MRDTPDYDSEYERAQYDQYWETHMEMCRKQSIARLAAVVKPPYTSIVGAIIAYAYDNEFDDAFTFAEALDFDDADIASMGEDIEIYKKCFKNSEWEKRGAWLREEEIDSYE